MHPRFRLAGLLADGRLHSGERLGARLGVGRGAIWRLIRGLRELGLEVYAVPGRGYRLAEAFVPLDAGRIRAALSAGARETIDELTVHPSIDSTNAWLLSHASGGRPGTSVCLAEHQGAGRGRRGRAWVSPYGANLYLSVQWRFERGPAWLAAVSLVSAVAVAVALEKWVPAGIGIKWPNDILLEGKKLAGILLETSGEPGGRGQVTVGVGINVAMPSAASRAIDQPWADLRSAGGGPLDRNPVAAAVTESLVSHLRRFSERGIESAREDWQRLDLARGRPVAVHLERGVVRGTAVGLDEEGALLVAVAGETRRFYSGEVSLRLAT